MKKGMSLFLGAIALAAVALITLGCEQAAGGESGGPVAGTAEVIQEVHIVQYTPPVVGYPDGRAPDYYAATPPGATLLVALSREHTGAAPVAADNFRISIGPGAKAPGYNSQDLNPASYDGVTAFPGDNKFWVVNNGVEDPVFTGSYAARGGTACYPAVYTIKLTAEIEDGQVITVMYDPMPAAALDWARDPVSVKETALDLMSDKAHIFGVYGSAVAGGVSPNYIDPSIIDNITAANRPFVRKGSTDFYDTITPHLDNFYGNKAFTEVYGARYDGSAKDFVLYRVQTSPSQLVEWLKFDVTPDAAGVLSFPSPPEGTEGYYVYNGGTFLADPVGTNARYDRLKPTVKIKSVTRADVNHLNIEVAVSEDGAVYYAQGKTVAQSDAASRYGEVTMSPDGNTLLGVAIDPAKLFGGDAVSPAPDYNTLEGEIAVTIKDRSGNWGGIDWAEIGMLIPAPSLVEVTVAANASANPNPYTPGALNAINWTSIQKGVQVSATLDGNGVAAASGGTAGIGTGGRDLLLKVRLKDRYGKIVELTADPPLNVPGAQSGTAQARLFDGALELRQIASLAETASGTNADAAIQLTAWLESEDGKLKSPEYLSPVGVYKDTVRPRMRAVSQIGAQKAAILWSEPIKTLGSPSFTATGLTGFSGSGTCAPDSRVQYWAGITAFAGAPSLGYEVADSASAIQDGFNNPAEGFPETPLAPPLTIADLAALYGLASPGDYTVTPGNIALTQTGVATVLASWGGSSDVFSVPPNTVMDAGNTQGAFELTKLTVQKGGTYKTGGVHSSDGLTIKTDGTLENYGTVEVESVGAGLTLTSGAGTAITGTGRIIAGGTAIAGGWNVTGGAQVVITPDAINGDASGNAALVGNGGVITVDPSRVGGKTFTVNSIIDLSARGSLVVSHGAAANTVVLLGDSTNAKGVIKLSAASVPVSWGAPHYVSDGYHTVEITGTAGALLGSADSPTAAVGSLSGGGATPANDVTITGKTTAAAPYDVTLKKDLKFAATAN